MAQKDELNVQKKAFGNYFILTQIALPLVAITMAIYNNLSYKVLLKRSATYLLWWVIVSVPA